MYHVIDTETGKSVPTTCLTQALFYQRTGLIYHQCRCCRVWGEGVDFRVGFCVDCAKQNQIDAITDNAAVTLTCTDGETMDFNFSDLAAAADFIDEAIAHGYEVEVYS